MDADLPDIDMPDMDLPDVDMPSMDEASTGVTAAALGIGASIKAAKEDVDDVNVAASLVTAGDEVEIPDSVSAAAAAMIANTNYPDDLTNIKGVGRVYENRLYQGGIFTWDQVANTTVQQLEEMTESIDAANVEDWPVQARALAAANDRVGARYNGPVPDKFSRLKGVGEGAEQSLYLAGIFTYAQLAATSPEDLAAAMPKSRGNFADWVDQAAKLA